MQQFSINPTGIFSLKDTLKIYKGKKIRKPSGLSLNPLFSKECHLLSDRPEGVAQGFIIESWGGLNFSMDSNLSESIWFIFLTP